MGARWEGGVTPADDVREVGAQTLLFHKKVTLSGLDTAVRTTPVDTGRLRAGWLVSTHASGSFEYGPDGLSAGAGASAEQLAGADTAMSSLRLGESTFIQDNVNYASFVNDGTVRMGGHHMVEAAIERMAREREGLP